jgi:glycosyltransferase involved in cell wall biosynthesis
MSSKALISADSPRVAIIVPAYGVAHLLAEALDSVLAQTESAWECIVVDDGAPDDVAGAVAPYLADPRIRFLQTDNGGVATARNRAIASATAPYITLLDGDDRLRPEYLAQILAVIAADDSIRIATCNAVMFGALPQERLCFDAPQPPGNLAAVLDRSFGVYIGSTFRRRDWERVGGFDPAFRHCEDFDFWVRLMQLGGQVHYVDAVLGDYRVRAGSASGESGPMLIGNLKVYEKARAALPAAAPEQRLIAELIAETRAALAFEHAIDRVIDGDARRGVRELAGLRRMVDGSVWTLSFALWRLFPQLARPMLRWRRRQHSRGFQRKSLRNLFESSPA